METSEKPLSLEDVFASYENRVQDFSGLIETTQELLLDSQESLSDLKYEQERVHGQLCEALATNGSLRRVDFSRMMQDLQREQRERELEVRSLLKDYLNRSALPNFKSSSARFASAKKSARKRCGLNCSGCNPRRGASSTLSGNC
ncbi:MAG: hypothetical protein NTV33_09290 [Coprothermobacterota bacterium]|nr:hypothetical protein [Coprothermobacterota bacterium]